MTNITDINIIGIDEERPPMVRKESYIDLFFKLSIKAPSDWCEAFNTLGHRIQPPVKIDPSQGLIVETYVHDMNLIQGQLDKIKEKIQQCNREYLENERKMKLAAAAKRAELTGNNAKQNQLNKIISGLNYEI